MADSQLSDIWRISNSKYKIAVIMPNMPTENSDFSLGASNMIWYKDSILICRDMCKINLSMKFPTVS